MKMLESLNSRFRIGTRIAAGFFAIQALLAIVAAVAYFGLGNARSSHETYSTISSNSASFLNAERAITAIRRDLMIYMQSGDPEMLESIGRGSRVVRESLGEVAKTAINQERRTQAQQMLASFEQLSNNIAQIEKAVPERRSKVQALNERGERFRQVLSDIIRDTLGGSEMTTAAYAGSSQEALMMINVNINRYLATNDSQFVSGVEQNFARAKSTIELVGDYSKNPQHSAAISRIEGELLPYLNELKSVIAISNDIHKLELDTSAIGDQLTHTSTQIREAQLQQLAAVRTSSYASLSSAVTISLAVTAIAMLLGFMLAWFIGRGVSRPILALSGSMRELADGNLRVEVQGTERADEVGEMARTVLTFRDGAIEKAAKDELNADYRGQIEAIGKVQAVVEFDLQGNVQQANENFLEIMGYELDEIKGRHENIFVDPRERETAQYRQFWEKLGGGEYDGGEYKRIAKDGSEVWFRATYNPIRDLNGTPFKVVQYATDVTKHKQRNADFEGQLAAIGKAQAVIEFALDGKVLNANENFLKTFGFTLEEIKGQAHAMLVEPGHRQSAEYRMFWEKLGRGEYDAGQYKRIRKDGAEIWIQASYNPILDLNGKPFKVVKYATEITAQVKSNEALQQAVRQTQIVVQAADGNDLSQRIPMDGKSGEIAALCAGVNGLLDTMSTVVAEIRAAASEVANASSEISAATTDLSQRTEEQAASLEQTSASMEEISATVKKNAENAQQASQSATGTREVASQGGEVVAQAVDAMSRIEESSRKIADIIGVIDEIARQTNLLALNAAVEAARAGDAGRGFAVVASEVRSLAQRSSQAAKDIKDLILNSTHQVKDGVNLVNNAGEQLKKIVESINGVAAIVSEIASASAEQASGIDQVNKALTQMDEVTQQNSALVEENAATAKTLEQSSAAMSERVAVFQLGEAAAAAVRMAVAAPAARPQPPAPAVRQPQPKAAPRRAEAAAAPAKPHVNGSGRGPVGRMQTALATALKDDPDWKEF
jgi:PAS domain S-box-containing protein